MPNDQASEDLIRNLLAGLAAKFDTDDCHVDAGVYEANRVAKLPGTWARKAPESPGRPWRQSSIVEVPERDIELPARAGQPRETIKELALEPVPLSLIQGAIAQLPVLQKSSADLEMSPNDVAKYEWLRNFLAQFKVPILAERASGKRLLLDIVCPWESEHGSTTGESSTSVWYVRGHGYGFRVCTANAPKRGWAGLIFARKSIQKAPPSPIYRDCRQTQRTPWSHAISGISARSSTTTRVSTTPVRMRATFVGSRWDLADQSNVLLMAALQPVCDRLRWDLPEPPPTAKRDYRRVLDSHPFRLARCSRAFRCWTGSDLTCWIRTPT